MIIPHDADGYALLSKLMRAEEAAKAQVTNAKRVFNEMAIFMHMQEMGRLLTFYRVQTRDNTVVVSEFGMGKMTKVVHDYSYTYGVDELPEWMRRKLAVLATLAFDKPTEELEGIGRRVSEHVYWVYPSADETLGVWGTRTKGEKGGADTGAKGKARRKKTA